MPRKSEQITRNYRTPCMRPVATAGFPSARHREMSRCRAAGIVVERAPPIFSGAIDIAIALTQRSGRGIQMASVLCVL